MSDDDEPDYGMSEYVEDRVHRLEVRALAQKQQLLALSEAVVAMQKDMVAANEVIDELQSDRADALDALDDKDEAVLDLTLQVQALVKTVAELKKRAAEQDKARQLAARVSPKASVVAAQMRLLTAAALASTSNSSSASSSCSSSSSSS